MTPQDKLVAAVEGLERLASAFGTLQEDRQSALDQYYGEPYGDELEGRSSVVMRDIADTVEWIKPSLMKVFASGEEVVRFDPVGPEDVAAAEQESQWCNHVLMNKNPGFMILHDWFHDALVQKTGYVWCNHETEQRPALERYKHLTDDEFTLVASGDVEVIEHAEYLDETGQTYHDAVIRKTKEYGCVKVRNVPPERVLIDANWPNVTLRGCPFVEIIERKTISDLRQEGYDVADDINDAASYTDDSLIGDARSQISKGWNADLDDTSADPSTRVVRVRYIWLNYDEDEDGIAELRHVVMVGREVLKDDETDLIPVAALTPYRIPHEHYGQSVADLVQDLQRIRTSLIRGYLDNMYLANNGRHAVDATRVNLDDLLVSRPGGIIRVQGDPASAMFPLVHPANGLGILQAIELVDSVRENRTGVTKYNQGLDADSLNKTAHGISQIMTAAQQRIDLVARIFAETGVKELFLLIHAISIKNGRQPELLRLRNEFIPVDPRQWVQRWDATVTVGLGTGNKDQMLQHLMLILQAQKEGLPLGLATPKNIYNALAKLTQNAGFKQPEEFWTDPEKAPPMQQPPSPEAIKAQAEQQKTQMQLQADAQKFQAEAALEQQRLAFEAAEKEKDRLAELERTRMQEATKLAIAEMNAEQAREQMSQSQQFEAQKMSATQEFEMKKTGAVPAEEVEAKDATMVELLRNLQSALHALNDSISRPRVAVRDPKTGRPMYGRPMTDEEMAGMRQ